MSRSRDAVFVVVPAYNESRVVFGVVDEIKREFPTVVVVDDGSSDDTSEQALRAGAIVLRHVVNRGQGAALQTGLAYAVREGAEVVVTFDADGQHQIGDVVRMVAALDEKNADVVIGSRFLGGAAHVPARRRMVLRLARLFMRLSSGVALTDAHNGLRVLRRNAAERIRITLDGMAHASEIVDQIARLELRVAETPVVIRYSEYSIQKGQSGLAAFRIAFDYLLKRWFR